MNEISNNNKVADVKTREKAVNEVDLTKEMNVKQRSILIVVTERKIRSQSNLE